MEDNKYYVPEIEEFHVGFEYEEQDEDDNWVSKVLDFDYGWIEIPTLFNTDKRVKYLDREDIESFGFIENDTTHFIDNKLLFGNKFECYKFEYKHLIFFIRPLSNLYPDSNNRIIISVFNNETMKGGEEPVILFNGTIKNKSELKKVLKQLNIIQ